MSDVTEALAQAAELTAAVQRISHEHVLRQHGAIALAPGTSDPGSGTIALVLDETTGGSLADLLVGRGQLTPGESVTIVAPLFGVLAELHAAGVRHGDLDPGKVLFSADGRPLLDGVGAGVTRHSGRKSGMDLGMDLGMHMGMGVGPGLGMGLGAPGRAPGFVAPEVVAGGAPSPASDVFAMAALGWFCLTGASPAPASSRPSLSTLSPQTPARLVEVLTSCLSVDPAGRPSADLAAIEVFDAAQAEPVVLELVVDPATEITRRIRAAAVLAPPPARPSVWQRVRRPLLIGVAALIVAAAIGGGVAWSLGRSTEVQPVAGQTLGKPSPSHLATTQEATPPTTVPSATRSPSTKKAPATPGRRQSVTDVVTARDSPRVAAAGLLQALVDARALAYVARDPSLLDLVYAPGAAGADVDRSNIATAVANGATYLGLTFVVGDVAFMDGTSATARLRATIVTPAYETGQRDGRKVHHAQEVVAASVFTVSLTRDGWRIVSLLAS